MRSTRLNSLPRFFIAAFVAALGISSSFAQAADGTSSLDGGVMCTPGVQGFDNVATLPGAGWAQINRSQPGPGTTNWFQGSSAAFSAHSGAATSYIAANFSNGTGVATLSNWLLTPTLGIQDGVVMTFWTRTVATPVLADRLQVRMSTNGESTNVGTTATSVGDFSTLLLDVNPTYSLSGYPNTWTQYTVTVTGVPALTTGRFAFRYFVENGGPSGANSDYIGIDSVQYSCIPATVSLPIDTFDTSVATNTTVIRPVRVTQIDPFGGPGPNPDPGSPGYVGFQGDFTFDSSVITFQTPFVQPAGLTASNWGVSGNVLAGPGPIKTLRISAFSLDFTPLSGSGTLFNLLMRRVSGVPGTASLLTWQPAPDNFQFVDDQLNTARPNQNNGLITIVGASIPIKISGTVLYCPNPVPGRVPSVTLTLTGTSSATTTTDVSGNYQFTSLPSGGTYTVTPSKTPLSPGSQGIDTVDALAVKQHFLNIALLPPGCRLTAADVNSDGAINTVDAIAIQRFFLNYSTGIGDTGKYMFIPASRTYPAVTSDRTDQNFDTLIFGDVASHFTYRPGSGSDE